MFHPKRGRRCNRTGPQPPHHLCPPQLGSRHPRPSQRPSRDPHWFHCRRLGEPPQRDVFHPKRGRRCNRIRPQPPHRLCPPQVGSRQRGSRRRPSRGLHWHRCHRLRRPPMRHVFHPKRGRRCNRTGPQPPHRLCPPHIGSRYLLLDCTQRPSRDPSLYRLCRRCTRPPRRDVFHPKRGRRNPRTGHQPPQHLCLPQVGSRCSRSSPTRRPSRGPRLNQCRRLVWPPLRDGIHPKRGRRRYRSGPQPPHRLCPPQVGSRYLLLDCTRTPSRGPSLYRLCRR